MQTHFRLDVPPDPTSPAWSRRLTRSTLNQPDGPTPAKPDRLAKLLRDQAREIFRSVTECQPLQIAAHIARLDDWRAVAALAMESGLVADHETQLTGQILAIAGPADCGKSTLQGIITTALGGSRGPPPWKKPWVTS